MGSIVPGAEFVVRFLDETLRKEAMAGLTKRGPYADNRVNPHEKNEIRYWCQKFTCTDIQLKNAVRAVGTSPEAVRDFLKGKKVG
ncbi:MAG: DUF3606 domain-containing protein [Syntrophobacteraceae bacterium]|jgi:hypothetical protein|nr:DUF3606 domain-containing protein [Syntrophobacteraceae bacterium]